MKALRKTTAKTRKGVIAWIGKMNPFLNQNWLYKQEQYIAVHLNKYTGAIVSYETASGQLVPVGPCNVIAKAA